MVSINLTARDRTILELVVRYRLLTNGALRRQLLRDLTANAVRRITARLCRAEFLRRFPLLPPETYFTPGPAAVRQLGVSRRRIEPLGPQALPTDFAILVYCTHGKSDRRRLTADELSDSAAWLPEELHTAPYCLTSDRCLELIRVDLGGSPQHVARRLAADASRLEAPDVAGPVACGRLQLVVLTTTSEKATLIRSALKAMGWSASVHIHLAVIPRLACLQWRNC